MSVYFNGRLVREQDLPPDHDPWLAMRNHWERAGAMRDVRISGDASIPEAIKLASSAELSGWLPYFDETVAAPDADWRFEAGQLIGRRHSELVAEANEALLQYHRPMLEDGVIEYEFYFQEGASQAHPAIGRLAFLLDRRGVREHWITDDKYDVSGLDSLNVTDQQSNRRGPAELPLVPDDWNRLQLALVGDKVHLTLNGQKVYERELEPTNPRTFGLFHYADQSEARVRGLTWKGDWPRELPPIKEQELAGDGTDFLDADPSKLAAGFEHDFATEGLPIDRFNVYERVAPRSPTTVDELSDGVHLIRPGAMGRFSTFSIIPRRTIKGDFDIEASFYKFEPQPPSVTQRTECSLILSAQFSDEAQTLAKLSHRHLRATGRDDNQRLQGWFGQTTEGETLASQSSFMVCDAEAGTLRMSRRREKVYFLIAENDSSYFRLVGEETLTNADLQPAGIEMMTRVLGPGTVKVVWTKFKIRATEVVDLAEQEIVKLQKQLTGDLPATGLEFDGRTQYVTVPSLEYDGSHPITLEAYITPDNGRGIAVGDNLRAGIGIGVLARRYRIHTWNGPVYDTAKRDAPSSNNLHVHLAGTFDGKTQSVFVNGKLADTVALARGFLPSGLPMTIGSSPPTPEGRLGYPFAGVIDGVRISKTVRYTKDFEPPAVMGADKQTLAAYRFDEGKGGVLHDSSGNEHHGSIIGAGWVSDIATRRRAALGLAAFGIRAVPALVAALEHNRADIRLEAANALGTMGSDAASALPALKRLENDNDQSVAAAAGLARARISRGP